MNTEKLHERLIAAARAVPPSDQVPLAFERRIMAHLSEVPGREPLMVWNRVLWRAAAPCVALMLAVGAWAYLSGLHLPADSDLSDDLELALSAPFAQVEAEW
jgi:hypothetical protein